MVQKLSQLGNDRPPQQDTIPMVRVCWDELMIFLRDLFKPRTARPYANLSRETITKQEYVKVVQWVIADSCKGELEGVTLNCPTAANFAERWNFY